MSRYELFCTFKLLQEFLEVLEVYEGASFRHVLAETGFLKLGGFRRKKLLKHLKKRKKENSNKFIKE